MTNYVTIEAKLLKLQDHFSVISIPENIFSL